MSQDPPPTPVDPNGAYDVALAETSPLDPRLIVAVEDEADKRAREAALASTYDPLIAHDGKSDEQMTKERQEALLLAVDVGFVTGVVLALSDTDSEEEPAALPLEDDGDAEPVDPDDAYLGP